MQLLNLKNACGFALTVLFLQACSGNHSTPAVGIPPMPGTNSTVAVSPIVMTAAALAGLSHVQLANDQSARFAPPSMPRDVSALQSQRHALSSTGAGDVEIAGTFVQGTGPYTGLFVQNTAYDSGDFPLSIPQGASGAEEMLAPLTSPPGGSCLSATTGALNKGGGAGTYFVVFNNCGSASPNTAGSVVVTQPIDATFKSKYVFTSNNLPEYALEIGTPDIHPTTVSMWYVLLFNYTTATWDIVYSYRGLSSLTYGYSAYYAISQPGQCPGGLPTVASNRISLFNPSGVVPTFNPASTELGTLTLAFAPGTFAGGSKCFTADSTGPATDTFTMTNPNTDWAVTSGQAYTYNVETTSGSYQIPYFATPPPPTSKFVTQGVTVTTGASFNGQPNLIDIHTRQTWPLASGEKHLSDAYEAYSASGGLTSVTQVGYTSLDYTLQSSKQYTQSDSPGYLLTQLPLFAGSTWNPNEAHQYTLNISDVGLPINSATLTGSDKSSATFASDGSYSLDESGNGTVNASYTYAFTRHYTVNSDASYHLIFGGADSAGINAVGSLTAGVPSGGFILVNASCQTGTAFPTVTPIAPATPNPDSCYDPYVGLSYPQFNESVSITNFYPPNYLPLVQDQRSVTGLNSPVPSTCNLSPSFGSTATQLHERYQVLDPAGTVNVALTDFYYMNVQNEMVLVCAISYNETGTYDVFGLTGDLFGDDYQSIITSLTGTTLNTMSLRRTASTGSSAASVADQAATAAMEGTIRGKTGEFFALSHAKAVRLQMERSHSPSARKRRRGQGR